MDDSKVKEIVEHVSEKMHSLIKDCNVHHSVEENTIRFNVSIMYVTTFVTEFTEGRLNIEAKELIKTFCTKKARDLSDLLMSRSLDISHNLLSKAENKPFQLKKPLGGG